MSRLNLRQHRDSLDVTQMEGKAYFSKHHNGKFKNFFICKSCIKNVTEGKVAKLAVKK